MMNEIPFIWVPISAMLCYSALVAALLSAKRNQTINALILVLVDCLCWTGGSMLMRLMIFPGYAFWYEVSLQALFVLPCLFANFLFHFVDARHAFSRLVWIVMTVALVIMTHGQMILKTPQLVVIGGRHVFQYHMEWTILIPTILAVFILGNGIYVAVKALHQSEVPTDGIRPIFWGLPILIVGNLISILPGNYFPWDTLAAIADALLMFYALYRKRLFRKSLLVSKGVVMLFSMTVWLVFGCFVVITFEEKLELLVPSMKAYVPLIIAALYGVAITLTYRMLQQVMGDLFLREEQQQTQRLQEFSTAATQSLKLKDVMTLLTNVTHEAIRTDRILICMRDKTGKHFLPQHAFTPLEDLNFSISSDTPYLIWFREHDQCLMISDFVRSPLYKSMWEAEKDLLWKRRIQCIVPMKKDQELIGVMLLGEKEKGKKYGYDDISFLESVRSIASMAVINANLYEQARHEAMTDYLTGLLNRKVFMEELERVFEESRDSSLALLILNLDDFKLFNQLYGSREGDRVLKQIGRILLNTVGHKGITGRYGGKEFAAAIPGYNMLQTWNLAENIRQQVEKITTNSDGVRLKELTFSGGICVMPYGATTLKELVENTDMAVYNAKRSGKNRICKYDIQDVSVDQQKLQSDVTGKYEDYAATIYALTAAIDAKDHYTFQHSQNVAKYATALAKAAGLNEEHVRMIHEAALLHDIGKIAIPEQILGKPGALTAEEYEIMKTHVDHSIEIIRHLPSLDYVIPAAIGHHERWDGKGYPRGVAGENLPIGARCLAIADSFDAMTSKRSYKNAFTAEFACKELLSRAGTQFDPNLAPMFVELVEKGVVKVAALNE